MGRWDAYAEKIYNRGGFTISQNTSKRKKASSKNKDLQEIEQHINQLRNRTASTHNTFSNQHKELQKEALYYIKEKKKKKEKSPEEGIRQIDQHADTKTNQQTDSFSTIPPKKIADDDSELSEPLPEEESKIQPTTINKKYTERDAAISEVTDDEAQFLEKKLSSDQPQKDPEQLQKDKEKQLVKSVASELKNLEQKQTISDHHPQPPKEETIKPHASSQSDTSSSQQSATTPTAASETSSQSTSFPRSKESIFVGGEKTTFLTKKKKQSPKRKNPFKKVTKIFTEKQTDIAELTKPKDAILPPELAKETATEEPQQPVSSSSAASHFEKPAQSSFTQTIQRLDGSIRSETKPGDIELDQIQPDDVIKYSQHAHQLKQQELQKLGYTKDSYDELDFYPLTEPFAYVQILRDRDTLDKLYVLSEAGLTEEEQQVLDFFRETLTSIDISCEKIEEKGERDYLIEQINQIVQEYMISIDEQATKKIIYYLEKQFLGLNKLDVLMRDSNIEDISCDGAKVPIFLYHRRYGSLKSNVQFEHEDELSAFVIKLAQKCGKHISIAEPMLDATMPDGSRIQMTLSTEVTTKGSTFTIRKFKEDPFSPPDLLEFNTMSSEMVAYMWLAVEKGINALIAGGTAAGKTSTLNAMSLFVPREAKIVSIEETREINLPHPNWIPGVSRSGFGEVVGNKVMGEINMYDLMKAALRQRPEYILVGEIRGREAYVLFQAMATGHTTYSTVHADSAQSLIYRLEGKPINIPRIMLQALDIVCIQVISRVKNKRARRTKQIIEIIDIDPTTKEILTNEVFRWDPVEDRFIYSGKSYVLERIRAAADLSRDEMTMELKNRAYLLTWMNKNNIREFKKVATIIAKYAENPKAVLKKIKSEEQ